MTASSLDVFVLDLSDPDYNQDPPQRVNDTLSYQLNDNSDVRTLSTNVPGSGGSVKGLLYVPELRSSDSCFNITKDYFPHNVTRRADLPDSGFALVAVAPWISMNCTSSYLAAARLDPVMAFFFYKPNNGTLEPPPANDPGWTLQDGGRWKGENDFGVYAVPGALGATLMTQLSLYSGNMTDVPNGAKLTEMYDPRDYIRLFAIVNLDNGTNLPSLWVFLLIVLGILLAIIFGTSLVMRLIQRKHRSTLRRRVANGEVDLEALGIKRLNVPQDVLDKMPLHTFKGEEPIFDHPSARRSGATPSQRPAPLNQATARAPQALDSVVSGSPTVPTVGQPRSRDDTSKSLISTSTVLSSRHVQFAQRTCPICLDDFESNATTVRELPCGHIFHPECVDTFLRESSSLCPMCKKSVLPLGYCPEKVTNAMVRRERLVRRMRERVTLDVVQDPSFELSTRMPPGRSVSGSASRRLESFQRQFGGASGRRVSSAPNPPTTSAEEVTLGPETAIAEPVPGHAPSRADTTMRREWGRNRLVASLENRVTVEDEDNAREAALPKWRKALGNIFPSLR